MASFVIRARKPGSPAIVVLGWNGPRFQPLHRRVLLSIPNNPSATWRSLASMQQPGNGGRAWNKRITYFIRMGRLCEARSVFDNLKQRGVVTWNTMISGYVRRKHMSEARTLFDEMPQRDVVTWNMLISGYVACPGGVYLDEGRFLFDRMPGRDDVSWNTMISGYARYGRMADALCLFNGMPQQSVVSWNAMITGFLQNGDTQTAIEWFKKMPERDFVSLNSLVYGLIQNGNLDDAAGIVLEFGSSDGCRDGLLQAYNTLIAGYGRRRRVDDARHLFDQIPVYRGHEGGTGRFIRNLVSWNSMIMCYVKAGDLVSARCLFDQMTVRDTFSWNTMISGYVHNSDIDEASNLFHRMPKPDALTWNSMISGHARLGNMELAQDMFDKMPEKNLITWNSIIAGYEENRDPRAAIRLFTQMRAEGQKPDQHTLSSVLSVCASFGDLCLGVQFHLQVVKTVIADIPINNSLITMYSRCGAITEAQRIFDSMKMQKSVVSWNAIIGGYACHGFAKQALKLFGEMKRNQVWPTHITFVSVLLACTHAGFVDEGKRQFNSMSREFGIEPLLEHYTLLVDILGRNGQLGEAMHLIRSMPVDPDSAVWCALLTSCRVHNNLDLARAAVEELVKLEPGNTAPYVLLYNMYAERGQWDEAAEVRSLMEKSNMPKPLAHSWVGFT